MNITTMPADLKASSHASTQPGHSRLGDLLSMWADVIRLAILIAFPILSLWLPSTMKKVDSPGDETLCLVVVVTTPTQENTA
jgi:hypothetical protein